MATISGESQNLSNGKSWESSLVLTAASTDERTSDAVDIRNAESVTLFVETSAGVNGGVVKLETAMTEDGPYFVAASVTTSAASTGYSANLSAGDDGLPAKYARARIETAIGVGTVEVYIVVQR